jgi:hypothetical protein
MNAILYLKPKCFLVGREALITNQRYVDVTNFTNYLDHIEKLFSIVEEPLVTQNNKVYLHAKLYPFLLAFSSDKSAIEISDLMSKCLVDQLIAFSE